MNMLEMAKELIKKGEELNDPELLTMGYNMLNKYSPESNVQAVEGYEDAAVEEPPKYVCSNCDHVVAYDKPNRKKCPLCKKHTLQVVHPVVEEVKRPHRVTAEDFSTQIRKPNSTRLRYNEEGQVDGTYARIEQVEGVTNIWHDDRTEGFDEANEQLKKLTKVSPRTRAPVRLVKVTCETCKTTREVHPIHVSGRARYVCDRCVRKRGRI